LVFSGKARLALTSRYIRPLLPFLPGFPGVNFSL
jgi:hypothetical protein